MEQGNMKHQKDFIAILVLRDLSEINDWPLKIKEGQITLNRLINGNFSVITGNDNSTLKVPTFDEMRKLRYYYSHNSSKIGVLFDDYFTKKFYREKAATVWLEVMLRTGQVEEGQIINLNEYDITDFITDSSLKLAFYKNEDTINKFVMEKRKKK